MRSLVFEGETWKTYEDLRRSDKRLHDQLQRVLSELLRGEPASGIGKPKKLKHGLSGYWSRRISQKDRAVYRYDDANIYIYAIGGHYDQV